MDFNQNRAHYEEQSVVRNVLTNMEKHMTSLDPTTAIESKNVFRRGIKILACGAFSLTLMACEDNIDNRQDRRDDRQDCRQDEGIVGGDKRDCKQDARTDSAEPTT